MTDHIPDVTNDNRRLAREWAEDIKSTTNSVESTTNPWSDRALAAARVILNDLAAPPTLADMTPAERRECRRMQCDVEGRSSMRYVIANPYDKDGEVTLMDSDGGVDWVFPEYVTPRPDLPRWEWPGTEKPVPAPALPEGWLLADHQRRGRVIVTRPEPDADGDVVIVGPVPDGLTRTDVSWCKRDRLTYIAGEPEENS